MLNRRLSCYFGHSASTLFDFKAAENNRLERKHREHRHIKSEMTDIENGEKSVCGSRGGHGREVVRGLFLLRRGLESRCYPVVTGLYRVFSINSLGESLGLALSNSQPILSRRNRDIHIS
ncbi:hypothetical protein TNCV_3249361 [Trichonephila clavipes]|nr:hypothetical protein TNCV_3249361 [Trichonephila clavipes]